MSIAEKLTQIAKNQQRVYEAGYVRGRNSNAYDEGYMQCAQDVDLATKMPFFLTPFEATAWYRATAEGDDVSVDNGVLYRRFRGIQSNSYGVSVTTVADKNNTESKCIAGKYLVFKMKTNYGGEGTVDFVTDIGIECEHVDDLQRYNGCHRVHERRLEDGYSLGSMSVPYDKWAVYVIDLSTICAEYVKNENGQYPAIKTAGIAFYTWANCERDHATYYVDLAYSAVCAEPNQVADLIKNDTAFLWDQSNRKWTTEFDFSTDSNEQNKILEEV